MLITNNKGFQRTIAKTVPLNNDAIYVLDNNKSFSLITSTKRLRSCHSKRINENKANNEFFSPITLI